jgi:hypothetical protein
MLVIGLLAVHGLVFGVFCLYIHLLSLNTTTGMIGLSVVIADVSLLSGVWRDRDWTRPMILVLGPPLTIYLGWLAVVSALTAPQVHVLLGGKPSLFEILRVLIPVAMLITTGAIFRIAWVAAMKTEGVGS